MAHELSVIIITWNMADLVRECLDRLLGQTHHASMEIIIVDNASRDGTTDIIRSEYPQVTLIANEENVGYARANNQAIGISKGRYILLHNTDAMVIEDAVDRMVAFMDAHPGVGVLGPRLLNVDGSLQRWTAGAFPSLGSAICHFFMLSRVAPGRRLLRGMYLSHDFDRPTEVDWVSSASFILRAEALREVGVLDETFFAYMEDVDICYRMKQAGWQVCYDPECSVVHYMGQNTKSRPGRVSPSSIRNLNAYFKRRHGLVPALLLKIIEALGFGLRMATYEVGARLTHNQEWSYRARLHRQYLKLSCERTI